MSLLTLDPPDTTVQKLMMRHQAGERLNDKEWARIQARVTAERETARVGGAVQGSIIPPAPKPAPNMQEQGRMTAQGEQDFNRGYDSVTRAPAAPGAGSVLGSPTGIASPMAAPKAVLDYRATHTEADNAGGPHMGADGQPAYWNTPTQIQGRDASTTATPGIPDGHGVIGGPGEFYISSPGGIVKNADGSRRRFNTMDDVTGYFASAPAQGAASKPAAAGPAAVAAFRGHGAGGSWDAPTLAANPTMDQRKDFIRQSGYGTFLDGPAPAPTATPPPAPAAAPDYTGSDTTAFGGKPLTRRIADWWNKATASNGTPLDTSAPALAGPMSAPDDRSLYDRSSGMPPAYRAMLFPGHGTGSTPTAGIASKPTVKTPTYPGTPTQKVLQAAADRFNPFSALKPNRKIAALPE